MNFNEKKQETIGRLEARLSELQATSDALHAQLRESPKDFPAPLAGKIPAIDGEARRLILEIHNLRFKFGV